MARRSRKPLFNAFGETFDNKVRNTRKRPSARKRSRQDTQTIFPVDGIHSFVWSNAIKPQDSALLKLPHEIRLSIFKYVLTEEPYIAPRKRYSKFWTPSNAELKGRRFTEPSAVQNAIVLCKLCRQIYVDVNGGAMLYKNNGFFFGGPRRATDYLRSINPFHKGAIRNVHVRFTVPQDESDRFNFVPPSAIAALMSCSSLEILTLEFTVYIEHLEVVDRCPRVKEEALELIREQQALKDIKGIKLFWLNFSVFRKYWEKNSGSEVMLWDDHCSRYQYKKYVDLKAELREIFKQDRDSARVLEDGI